MAVVPDGAVTRGAAWMLLSRVGTILGLINIAIAARLLTPTDFAIFQMALSVMIAVEVFTLFGFDWALIQHPDPKREHFDTAWTLQMMVSIAASLVILALAYPMALFYREPQLVVVVAVFAALPIINGLSNMAMAHLRREFRFKRDFVRMIVPRIVSFTACVTAAVMLESYWALCIGAFADRIAWILAGYVLHPYRPRPCLSKWRELCNFSFWLQANAIIDAIRMRFSDFVIGRMLGASPLALYNMSVEISNTAQYEFVGALNSAMYSKYSRIQENREELRNAYLDVLALVLLVASPICIGIYMTAGPSIMLLLGPKWVEAIPIMQIVVFGSLALSLGENTRFVLMSVGKPKISTALSTVSLMVVLVLLISLTISYGILGAAIAFAIANALMLPVHFMVLRHVLGLRLSHVVARAWRPGLAVATMAAILMLIGSAATPQTSLDAFVSLLIAVPLGAAIYVMSVAAAWYAVGRPPGIEAATLAHLQRMFGGLLRRLRNRDTLAEID